MIWNEDRVMIYEARGLPEEHHVSVQRAKGSGEWSWHIDMEDEGAHHEAVISIHGREASMEGAKVEAQLRYEKALKAMALLEVNQ